MSGSTSTSQLEQQYGIIDAITSMQTAPDMYILVSSDLSVPAHAQLIRLVSSCAAGAPEPFTHWDLRELRCGADGGPPTAEVVISWLELVYFSSVCAKARTHTPRNLVNALPLLRFADAIGSSRAIVELLMIVVNDFSLQLTWPVKDTDQKPDADAQLVAEIDLSSPRVWHFQQYFDFDGTTSLVGGDDCGEEDAGEEPVVHFKSLTPNCEDQLRQQVVTQLEELMYVAHHLQLQPLRESLEGFLRGQYSECQPEDDTSCLLITPTVFGQVFSRRVVEALDREALMKLYFKHVGRPGFC